MRFRASTPWIAVILVLFAAPALAAADVQVNQDAPGAVQNEPRITLNPADSSNLAVAYNDSIGTVASPLGVSYSTDGGTSWADVQLSIPAHPMLGTPDDGIALPFIFDPFIDAGPGGDIYAGYVAADGSSGGPNGLYLERSTDKGKTWSGPINISFDQRAVIPSAYRFNDRPDMTVDAAGNVIVVSIKDVGMAGPTSDIYFARSPAPPAGLDFTGGAAGSVASKTINDNPNGGDWANVPDVVVASDGTIYVSWINVDVTNPLVKPGTLMLDKSTDNGATFGSDKAVLQINALAGALNTGAGIPDARSGSYAVIGVDPVQSQQVYLAYAANPGGADDGDIYFIRSLDGGATWSAPLRVNTDTTTNDQFHPMMSVTPAGTIVLGWYDRRNDPGDAQWDVYLTTSNDGGLTFATESQVNDTSFATPTDVWGQPWMGEYLGLDTAGRTAYLSFTSSTSDALGDIYFDTRRLPKRPKRCSGFLATITGTQGADTITGTAGPDVIVGRGGDDVINGGAGDDIICGNRGDDTLSGDDGDDRVVGGGGRDTIRGNKGLDRLFGGHAADFVSGGAADDRVSGGTGRDQLFGNGGDDRLRGEDQNDQLDGGPGTDLLNGGPGSDTCVAGETLISC